MKLDVYIKPTHEVVIFPMSCVGAYGVVSEDNSIILNMHFPENLVEAGSSTVKKELVATTSQGSFCYPLLKETFELPAEVMSDIIVKLQIKVSSKSFIWKTFPFILKLKEGLDESGDNVYEQVVTAAREECRADLASSLETATGENHDNKTWDELNGTVATLPVIDEQQRQALSDLDLIKIYFENYKGTSHNLFKIAPKDADGNNMTYRLPYIYTPALPWSANALAFSTEILEAGVDVSSAVNLGGGGTTRTFSPLPKLEKLILTGNAENPSLYNFMCTNYELRYIKMETPSKTVLNANAEYYKRAFYRCERLQTIDCELDFTGQTDTAGMFTNCYMLKDLRIKPFTLTCSLDVRSCKYFVHPEIIDSSLLSILNAIPNPKDGENAGITITYSDEGWLMGSMGTDGTLPAEFISTEVYFNPETGLYSYEKQTESDEKMSMLKAFTERKGVTLAQ